MSLPVTEDTPPDMLAGSMDLNVVLPNGQTVKMSVQRGTPMMDLLVQATTTHCLSPGDYSLQAMGDKGVLPFKPNTPIGALDTFTVKVVEKKSQGRGRAPQVPQSFLNTFRLQIHLPRSQLFVLRVTPDVTLHDIMTHVCTEKNLTAEKYEFRNTAKLNEVLELNKTLGYYKVQELSLVNKSNSTVAGLMSSADLLKVKSSKHRQNSVCDSSLSSGSFGSRSGSPVPAIHVVTTPPQPPKRKKRRPAPKPPSHAEKEQQKKNHNFGSVLISHSRESSDSSGYHEASILSESPTHGGPVVGSESGSPPDTLPRRSKLPSSQSFTNLTSIQPAPKGRLITSVSNTSLNSNGCGRKKRAPPPPSSTFKSVAASSTLGESQMEKLNESKMKSSTLPTIKTENVRNDYGLMNVGSHVTSAKVVGDEDYEDEDEEDDDVDDNDNDNDNDNYNVPSTDGSNAKVQIPVEITSRIVNHETKARIDELSTVEDLGIKVPPKPKPRTVAILRHHSETTTLVYSSSPRRRSCLDNLKEEDGPEVTVANENGFENDVESTSETFSRCKKLDGFVTKNGGDDILGTRGGDSVPVDGVDQADHDSINWEYQLPPPPTDFRDANSPTCTEFGTITITPEILERMEPYRAEDVSDWSRKSENYLGKTTSSNLKSDKVKEKKVNNFIIQSDSNCTIGHQVSNEYNDSRSDKKTSQGKPEVMSELTNILNVENRKQKEKSLSVSNLYISEPVDQEERGMKKSNSHLNYSRSFSTEMAPCLNQCENIINVRCSSNEYNKFQKQFQNGDVNDEDKSSDNDINYKNYKNWEKSSSLDCVEKKRPNSLHLIGREEDDVEEPGEKEDDEGGVFKKPVAYIQKKSKMARRSASSISTNPRRYSVESEKQTWTEDANLNILRQQFLEFLKEKKLMNADFKMKSFDVLRDILPEVVKGNGDGDGDGDGGDGRVSVEEVNGVNVDSSNEKSKVSESICLRDISHEHAQKESKNGREDRVKIVDVKVKNPVNRETAENLEKLKRSERNTVIATIFADSNNSNTKNTNANEMKEEVTLREKTAVQKSGVGKRYSYQGPPSINFGTWGERPKTATKIIIKDEDYITREKVTERKAEAYVPKNPPQPAAVSRTTEENVSAKKLETKTEGVKNLGGLSTPKNVNGSGPEVKKSQIFIKKPGGLSHYEMFSALPKRKEINSLRFFLEEEEKRRNQQEANRVVPVVCGIELKKELKEKETEVPIPTKFTSLPHNPAKSHSVSVYVNGNGNGNGEVEEKFKAGIPGTGKNFMIPKRNPSLMPVVKGFRSSEEQHQSKNGGNAQSGTAFNEERRTPFNHSTVTPISAPSVPPPVPIPPPPFSNVTSIKLRGDCIEHRRSKPSFDPDPRTQLLDEIRNFGGLRKLKRPAVF